MRQFFPFLFFIAAFNTVFAQSNANYAGTQVVVKYDAYTRVITGSIPFDKPFKIEVDNVDTSGILQVQLYEVVFEDGVRNLRMPYGASSVLTGDAITKSKNTITLSMPGIQAEKNFDIAIIRKLSVSNISRIYELNKKIRVDYNGQSAPAIRAAQPLADGYTLILETIGGFRQNTQRRGISAQILTIKEYYDNVYLPAVGYYDNIRDIQPLSLATYNLDQTRLSLIVNKLSDKTAFYNRIPVLQKTIDDNRFPDVSKGLLPMDYKYPVKLTGVYEIETRLKNLTRTTLYFDSLLNVAVRPLEAADHAAFGPVVADLKQLLSDLIDKRDYLRGRTELIAKEFTKYVAVQTLWLNGTDDFTDLKVKGAAIFTLDAGIMNIFTYNNYNNMVQIPKLYFGINIHLLPNDKTLANKYLKNLPPEPGQQHTLESQPSIWRTAAITIGVTLGGMQNKDFDNVTNGLSFTAGPSFRFYKAFRFGFGAAMLRRIDPNPLMSDKKIVPGFYAALSIDFDLLDPIKSVTSMIFK